MKTIYDVKELEIGDLLFIGGDYTKLWKIEKMTDFSIELKNALFEYGYYSPFVSTFFHTETSNITGTFCWQNKLINSDFDVIGKEFNNTIISKIKNQCNGNPLQEVLVSIVEKKCSKVLPHWGYYRCEFSHQTGEFVRAIFQEHAYYNKETTFRLNKFINDYFWDCLSVYVEASNQIDAKVISKGLFEKVEKKIIVVVN